MKNSSRILILVAAMSIGIAALADIVVPGGGPVGGPRGGGPVIVIGGGNPPPIVRGGGGFPGGPIYPPTNPPYYPPNPPYYPPNPPYYPPNPPSYPPVYGNCSQFYVGEYIYDTDTGIQKTAQITAIYGCEATISYYGSWSGVYNVDLNSGYIQPQNSYGGQCSQFQVGEYVYDTDTGTAKTAQIVAIQGCVATINYYGNWSGTYNVDLNSGYVTPQNSYNSRCSQFYQGEYIYDADTGIPKTAQITSIRGCSATISYYGNWSGEYTIDLNSPVVYPQR